MFGLLVLYNAGKTTRLNSICSEICASYKVSYANSDEIFLEKTLDEFDLQSGDFFLANTEEDRPCTIPIPTKGSSAVSWFKGFVPDTDKKKIDLLTGLSNKLFVADGYYPAKLLVKLNSYRHEHSQDQEMNYTSLVHNRVISYLLDGAFSVSLAYMTKSNRSRIVIASKDRDLYFTLVYANDFYALVWSDNYNVAQDFKARGAYLYSMTPMAYGGTYVIHPKFLMSKWKKWRTTTTGEISKASNSLKAVSILENYILRNTVKLESCLETVCFKFSPIEEARQHAQTADPELLQKLNNPEG